jgi:hypothetical protein
VSIAREGYGGEPARAIFLDPAAGGNDDDNNHESERGKELAELLQLPPILLKNVVINFDERHVRNESLICPRVRHSIVACWRTATIVL